MTILVYRDGIMASDTSASMGRSTHRWSDKLHRAGDGTLYGACGECAEGQAYFDWLRSPGERPEPLPRDVDGDGSFGILRVGRDRVVHCLTPCGWERFVAPYYAYGGGQAPAWGALYAGADAETAVRAAIEHSGAAKGDVRAIRHEG